MPRLDVVYMLKQINQYLCPDKEVTKQRKYLFLSLDEIVDQPNISYYMKYIACLADFRQDKMKSIILVSFLVFSILTA